MKAFSFSVRKTLLSAAVSATLGVCAVPMAIAETAEPFMTEAAAQEAPSSFVRKSKNIRGDIQIVTRGEQRFVVFSEDFKATRGPDLKVFLSPRAVADATGRNATRGSIKLGRLQSRKGAQEYEIPASVDLSDFESVLVHCEAFAVLWGGAAV